MWRLGKVVMSTCKEFSEKKIERKRREGAQRERERERERDQM
jgi:hypothetical protein